nr:hypothetical protein GCM10020185_62750 [Pseudomonas brassicacearum subsp. brassicacearum]
MLILTRKVGESINIGDDITITILGVSGQQVRIGINAPKKTLRCIAKRFTSVFRRASLPPDKPQTP